VALEQRKTRTALKALSDPAAQSKYDATLADIIASKARLVQLNAALVAAKAQALSELREKQKYEREALLKRLQKILDKRTQAAIGLQAALGQMAEAWKQILSTTAQVRMAYPGGSGAIPRGCLSDTAALRSLAHALYGASVPHDRGIPNLGAGLPGAGRDPSGNSCGDVGKDIYADGAWALASIAAGPTEPLIDPFADEGEDIDQPTGPIVLDYRKEPK
jgi:hypothetical protein